MSSVSVEPNAFYGDIDLDGKVSLTDAVLLAKIAAGQVVANDQQRLNADLNGDSTLDSEDAIILLRFLVRLINVIPTK